MSENTFCGLEAVLSDLNDVAEEGFSVPPHVIPYQGSKRLLAPKICKLFPEGVETLYEPFAGSAAISLFAAKNGLAKRFVIGDVYEPLVNLLKMVVERPADIADQYADIWHKQVFEDSNYYYRVREAFNKDKDPVKLLYLVSRCVKNAVRFSKTGDFNQSCDTRRLGTHPDKLKDNVLSVSELLKGRTEFFVGSYDDCVREARPVDLVYMDPPYQGTSTGADNRYFQGLQRDHLVAQIKKLNHRGIPFILSYDGICGTKVYGDALPDSLSMKRILLDAGKSAQATLNGNDHQTFESVYTPYFLHFMRTPQELVSEDIMNYVGKVTKKRAKLVLETILARGFITTEQIREEIKQKHPPRAAQDVKDLGIPLRNYEFSMPDGTRNSYYTFDLDLPLDERRIGGRSALTKKLRAEMLAHYGRIHAFTGEPLPDSLLQVDHRVPFAVAGEVDALRVADFMFLDPTYQRRKSTACEGCSNFKKKELTVCQSCFWAYPNKYTHVAGDDLRRIDVTWQGHEVQIYNALVKAAAEKEQSPQSYLKDVCSKEVARLEQTSTGDAKEPKGQAQVK